MRIKEKGNYFDEDLKDVLARELFKTQSWESSLGIESQINRLIGVSTYLAETLFIKGLIDKTELLNLFNINNQDKFEIIP